MSLDKPSQNKNTHSFFDKIESLSSKNLLLLTSILMAIFISLSLESSDISYIWGWNEDLVLSEWAKNFSSNKWVLKIDNITVWDLVILNEEERYQQNKNMERLESFLWSEDFTLKYPTLEETPETFHEYIHSNQKLLKFYTLLYDLVVEHVTNRKDLHVSYRSSPWMVLWQIALETWYLEKCSQIFIENHNILWLKYKPSGWIEWVDYFLALDAKEWRCKYTIFESDKACIDAYFDNHLNHPRYIDQLDRLQKHEIKNPYIRMAIVATGRVSYESEWFEKVWYASINDYMDRVVKIFSIQNRKLGDPSDVHVFQRRIWDTETLKQKMNSYPWFKKSSSQAKADMISFLETHAWYLLPNGSMIYYIPNEWSQILQWYWNNYQAEFEAKKEELLATLDQYSPTSEQRQEYRKAKEVYDNTEYVSITPQQAEQLLKDSYEPWYENKNTIYMIQYDVGEWDIVMDKLHRDRELWEYWKRWIIPHWSQSWNVDSNWNITNWSRVFSPLDQDLSNIRTWINRMNGKWKHLDIYGSMISKNWLIIQFWYPNIFHGACNWPKSKKVLWANFSDMLFPIECTQAWDVNSLTAMEPLTPKQKEGLKRAILFYKFLFNTNTVVTSADVLRNKFSVINNTNNLLTLWAHKDDLSDTEREYLWILSIDEVLKNYYGTHWTPLQIDPRVNAFYNSFLSNPEKHLEYINKREVRKRMWKVKLQSLFLKWNITDYSDFTKKHWEVLSWRRNWEWRLIFPHDYLMDWEDGWTRYLWKWDEVFVEKKWFFERLFD